MGYADSLRAKAAYIASGDDHPSELAYLNRWLDLSRLANPEGGPIEAITLSRTLRASMARSDVFYIAPPIMDLISAAAETIPADTTTRTDIFPCDNGMIYLPQPLTSTYDQIEGDAIQDLPERLRGTQSVNHRIIMWERRPLNPNAITIITLRDILDPQEGLHPPYKLTISTHFEGGRPLIREDIPPSIVRLRAFMATFVEFIQQRVLTSEREAVRNKSARRNIVNLAPIEPVANVIYLRASEGEVEEGTRGEGASKRYTCRWLVRPHWQRYHTKEGVRSIFKRSTTAGPKGLPLKVGDRIYALTR